MSNLNVEERICQEPFNLPKQRHKSLDINKGNGWVIVDFFRSCITDVLRKVPLFVPSNNKKNSGQTVFCFLTVTLSCEIKLNAEKM